MGSREANHANAAWKLILEVDPFTSTEWQNDAACKDAWNPDIFFMDLRGSTEETRSRWIEEVERIYCNKCAVREQCEIYSDTYALGWGKWGRITYGNSDR